MNHTVEGTVAGQPRHRGEFTEFSLACGPQSYRVIRMDKQWQIKDLLFLCDGQWLRVTGTAEEEKILATKIEITDCSNRNYLKEKGNGNSSITGTDSSDPQV